MPEQVRLYPHLTFPTHPALLATPIFALAPNGYFPSVPSFNYIYLLLKTPLLHSRAILAGGSLLLIIFSATIVIYRHPTTRNNSTRFRTMTSCARIFLSHTAKLMAPALTSRQLLLPGPLPHPHLPPHPKQVHSI
jgi:hypothetical protein